MVVVVMRSTACLRSATSAWSAARSTSNSATRSTSWRCFAEVIWLSTLESCTRACSSAASIAARRSMICPTSRGTSAVETLFWKAVSSLLAFASSLRVVVSWSFMFFEVWSCRSVPASNRKSFRAFT